MLSLSGSGPGPLPHPRPQVTSEETEAGAVLTVHVQTLDDDLQLHLVGHVAQ